MEEQLIPVSRAANRKRVRLIVIDDGDVRNERGIEN